MRCLYHLTKDGVCILRCYSLDSIAELPSKIEGKPVTELGAYAFSDHFSMEDYEKETLMLWNTVSEKSREVSVSDMQNVIADINSRDGKALAGGDLTEVWLPDSLGKIGRYAFYNCFSLKRLSFGENLKDVGAGAFTGCHQIGELQVRAAEEKAGCLRDILTEVTEELLVVYERQGEEARFWFPEYFEEGVENTPARILENHVHGSGLRYRNCFRNRVLQVREYDSLFESAKAWENPKTVIRLVFDRLRYPMKLSAEAEKQYAAYLEKKQREAGELLLQKKQTEDLSFFLKKIPVAQETLEELLQLAAKEGFPEGVACLMEEKGRRFAPKRRSFDL